ncbi:MAG: 7-carboxy-7-deazaguanine synthase QueE [Candidatus Aminicenantaceae bacterium]
MPQQHTLKINEIFPSVQGEGLRQGEPTLFVRFSGCTERCDFCDTKYAWEKGIDYFPSQIVKKIKELHSKFPAGWVCLTGGEPLEQDPGELTRILKKEKFKIQVETNAKTYRELPVDWYTVSPKPDDYSFMPEYREKAKEVKIIGTKGLQIEPIKKLRKAFPPETPILLQPQSNKKWSKSLCVELLYESLKLGISNIRLSLQLHKAYQLK